MENKLQQLTQIFKENNNIVFFGGAGVSTESNIPDFRSSTGIFNQKLNINLSPEQIVSHSFFYRYPEYFFNFYKEKLVYKDAKPNNAHIALAKLEEQGKLNGIITQNIDGLHQLAGSKKVFELHGSIHRNYCTNCNKFYSLDELLLLSNPIPHCTICSKPIKPDVVLYEEGLDDNTVESAIRLISNADVLIIGGTSLKVYPAAGFVRYFRGKHLILINKTSTEYDHLATLIINEPIGEFLKYAILG